MCEIWGRRVRGVVGRQAGKGGVFTMEDEENSRSSSRSFGLLGRLRSIPPRQSMSESIPVLSVGKDHTTDPAIGRRPFRLPTFTYFFGVFGLKGTLQTWDLCLPDESWPWES